MDRRNVDIKNDFFELKTFQNEVVNKKRIIYRPNRRELIVFLFRASKMPQHANSSHRNEIRCCVDVCFLLLLCGNFEFKYFDRRVLNERFHSILISYHRVNKNLAKNS